MKNYNEIETVVKDIVTRKIDSETRAAMVASLLHEYPAPALIEVVTVMLCRQLQAYEERIMPRKATGGAEC